jgi:hypothetical protein
VALAILFSEKKIFLDLARKKNLDWSGIESTALYKVTTDHIPIGDLPENSDG